MIRLACAGLLLLSTTAAPPAAMVSVVVATRDIPVGEVVVYASISKLDVPAEWATRSVVKADSVSYVVNEKTMSPFLKGDILRWAAFENEMGNHFVPPCGDAEPAALTVAKARQVQLAR